MVFGGWKRQRREVECAVLSASPPSVADAAAVAASVDTPSSSICGSDCSDSDFLRDMMGGAGSGSLPRSPHAAALVRQASDSSSSGSNGSLIDMASSSGRSLAASRGARELASVRAKAAYFEALIRSNTTAYVQCSVDGASHHVLSQDSTGEPMCVDDQAAVEAAAVAEAEADQGEDEALDYSEVQLVVRVPQPRLLVRPASLPTSHPGSSPSPAAAAAHERYGSVEQMAALIEQLSAQLGVSERERCAAASLAQRKCQEVDNLTRVVRELSESRSKAVYAKASLQEKYCDLQAEYHRMLRIADLSRTVSKENIAKTSRTQKQLKAVELELRATRRQADSLQEKSMRTRVENLQLKERMALLERLECFEEVQESVCMKQFSRYSLRIQETY